MATITVVPGARQTLTTTALNSLASATYVSAGVIDVSAIDPLDVVVEIAATPVMVGGIKQLSVFARVSFNGTDYTTGPTSGTNATDEPNLRLLGVLPLNTDNTMQRNAMSVMSALGYVPPYMDVVVKNEIGTALASSGHGVYWTAFTGNSS